MKNFFTKNIGLKILSIVLAVIVWVIAVNISNPEIKASKQVEVEIRNGDIIENAGKTYKILDGTTVSIVYSVRTRDAYKIKASDFKAYIDMNDLYEVTGSVPIFVDIVGNENLILDASAKPNVIRVQVEDVVKLSKDVVYELDGEPQEGYTVGSVELNPSNITVSGPESTVNQIKDIKIVIDVNGISEDLEGSATPVFTDSIGRTVDVSGEGVHVNHSTVGYHVYTLVGKTVPVQYNVSGTPAEGYSFSGAEATINQVVIRGPKAVLAEVNSIVVPKENLSVNGLSSNTEVLVDLSQFIPDGLEIVGESTSIVTLKVEGQRTRHYTVNSTQFAIANPKDGYEYLIEPITTDVELAGLEEDLDALDPKDILGSVDVNGFEEEGTYAVEPMFTLPAGYSVKSHSNITVTVKKTYEGILRDHDENGEEHERRNPEDAENKNPDSENAGNKHSDLEESEISEETENTENTDNTESTEKTSEEETAE